MKLDNRVTQTLMQLYKALAPGTSITVRVPAQKLFIPGQEDLSRGGELIVVRPAIPLHVNVSLTPNVSSDSSSSDNSNNNNETKGEQNEAV